MSVFVLGVLIGRSGSWHARELEFWLVTKDGSETLKNLAETLAVLGAAGAIYQWQFQRHDREADTLFRLEELFGKAELLAARRWLENRSRGEDGKYPPITNADYPTLDPLLRFYVVLLGVMNGRQVNHRSVASCYRYWIGYAAKCNHDRFDPTLREYITRSWRTLEAWLSAEGDDAKNADSFFVGT